MGQNQLAWYAFERGLSISPKHAPMLEKFMEVGVSLRCCGIWCNFNFDRLYFTVLFIFKSGEYAGIGLLMDCTQELGFMYTLIFI